MSRPRACNVRKFRDLIIPAADASANLLVDVREALKRRVTAHRAIRRHVPNQQHSIQAVVAPKRPLPLSRRHALDQRCCSYVQRLDAHIVLGLAPLGSQRRPRDPPRPMRALRRLMRSIHGNNAAVAPERRVPVLHRVTLMPQFARHERTPQ